MDNKQTKDFTFDGEKYQIDISKFISRGGDIDLANKTICVDRSIPEKFHEGIAVHEITERKFLEKGHTYVFSHNEAQKRELEFYEKIFGKEKSVAALEEEEELILTIYNRRNHPSSKSIVKEEEEDEKKETPMEKPLLEIKTIKEMVFDDKRYIINNFERLIGTLVDVYERGGILYIDRDVPERFFEGLALSELVTRKALKRGLSWTDASLEGNKAEEDYLTMKYGSEVGKEIINDELKFQAWKFATEKKELKLESGGHKVIYDKSEILPK